MAKVPTIYATESEAFAAAAAQVKLMVYHGKPHATLRVLSAVNEGGFRAMIVPARGLAGFNSEMPFYL